MWTCFLLTPTDRAWNALRRTSASPATPCPNSPHGHNAVVEVEPSAFALTGEGYYPATNWPKDDPRWPARCSCGYTFQPHDYWSYDQEQIYLTPDGREVGTHPRLRGSGRLAPAGSMWIAQWVPKNDAWTGLDGLCLMLMLPDGTEWMIDGPARNGGRWTRTGSPPRITARPSIASPGYHGWLTDGVLSDDLEGRSY